ncbi:MAG: hypothetical protein ACREFJ_09240, partial [Acetobacteraceae bacterium]
AAQCAAPRGPGGVAAFLDPAIGIPLVHPPDATIIVLVNSRRQPEGKWDVASETVHNIAKVLDPKHVPL